MYRLNGGRIINKTKEGRKYESIVAEHLKKRGWHILQTNYRCRGAEIDIIAQTGGQRAHYSFDGMEDSILVFVEVKYRAAGTFGYPAEAVDVRKRQKIRRAAMHYMLKNNVPETRPCRFDVAAVDGFGNISYLENAFGGI